jgi:hypothetical protein
MTASNIDFNTHSYLAFHFHDGLVRPLQVMKSGAGFYIGSCCPKTYAPLTRDSVEYYRYSYEASAALSGCTWTQRLNP